MHIAGTSSGLVASHSAGAARSAAGLNRSKRRSTYHRRRSPIEAIWDQYFSAYAYTEAVEFLAASALQNWRSNIGKRASKLSRHAATHLRYVSYGHLIGAASLVAAALERALAICKDGMPSTEGFPRRGKKNAHGCFKLAEAFQLAAGNAVTATPTAENTPAWSILLLIVSAIPVSNRVTTPSPRARSSIPPPSTSPPSYLNTSPSPALGVAPFRGFVQEHVALARHWIEKNGPDALADWGWISLFDGCRKSTQGFLYKEEWPQYIEELQGKSSMHCTFSREPP
ncbi:hypothetical protein K438DRAFT_1784457 [Mycena galopus ATCC 62051]|nr:hypothetical protein K438DRAFT_1784457 [Mycena galopus ATCC 62051]